MWPTLPFVVCRAFLLLRSLGARMMEVVLCVAFGVIDPVLGTTRQSDCDIFAG